MHNMPFQPVMSGANQVSNYRVSVTNASANQKLQSASSIRIANLGTITAYINFGTINVAAVASTDIPILPGVIEVMSVPLGAEYIAYITAASTTTLSITPGDGV